MRWNGIQKEKSIPRLPSATRTSCEKTNGLYLEGSLGGHVPRKSQVSVKARKCREYRLRLYFQINRCPRGHKESDLNRGQ